ncbi:hypothetical protein [Sinomicrobium oceani]|uniref:hypothetical protein n=1 Tax=Sinomicrobium oceani TaxID=1150368 RepID=UPI00227ADA05|nr:hypothetical protein [Sinomicrobium oceani]
MEAQDIPKLYHSPNRMENPNDRMTIHSGSFILRKAKDHTSEFTVNGTIELKWSPGVNIVLNGEVRERHSMEFFKWCLENNDFEILVNGSYIGSCFITNKGNERDINGEGIVDIRGVFNSKVVLGASTKKVNEIRFVLPNIKKFPGDPVRHGTRFLSNRIHLVYDSMDITIDLSPDYKDLFAKLKDEGGYIFLASGKLTTSVPIDIEESRDILYCLSRFLTFLNGRRTSPFLRQGYKDGKILWTDFSNYHVDIHKNSPSVAPIGDFIDFGVLWRAFRKLWVEDHEQIRTSVHWFVEANNDAIFIEGSIILSQTNLELLFNWLIVERKNIKVTTGGAANKIRVLLSHIDLSPDIPEKCVHLLEFLKGNDNFQNMDGPEIITSIRNAIVHAKKVKRDRWGTLGTMARHEALQLSLWYIERVLLYVMDYKGNYYNRISKEVETID